jgi:hypothetical protein
MYYTYAYLREDRTPYYIGKGKNARAFLAHKRRKGRLVPLPSKDRILILKKFENENEAFKHEKYMIAILGRKNNGTGILRNFTDGGEGISGYKFSEESKLTKSIIMTGKKRGEPSVETKEKIRKSNLGKTPWNKGKKGLQVHNEETRKQMSKSHTGKKMENSTIEKRTKSICKKTYKVISPEKIEYYINNICEFCRNNNLDSGNMYRVLSGGQKTHKGWIVELIT